MLCCEWCGHEHDQRALCTKRPTWGRRGFLALLGASAVGAVLPAVPLLRPGDELVLYHVTEIPTRKIWARIVITGPELLRALNAPAGAAWKAFLQIEQAEREATYRDIGAR